MAATTALLLPGLDGTGDLFEPFASVAPPGIETVVVNYPHNESSMEVLEKRAREKLAERSIIIAESFSGPIGARLATDARVRALVLCNSFISSPFVASAPHAGLPSFLRHLAVAPLFSIPIPDFLLRSALLGSRAAPALVEKTRRAIRSIPARVLAGRVRQVLQADERQTLRGPGQAGPLPAWSQ